MEFLGSLMRKRRELGDPSLPCQAWVRQPLAFGDVSIQPRAVYHKIPDFPYCDFLPPQNRARSSWRASQRGRSEIFLLPYLPACWYSPHALSRKWVLVHRYAMLAGRQYRLSLFDGAV